MPSLLACFTSLDGYVCLLVVQLWKVLPLVIGTNFLVGKGNMVPSKVSATHGAETFSKDVMLGFGTEKQEGSNLWSAVSKEAEALMDLSDQASCYSKPNKTLKGIIFYVFLKIYTVC